MIIDKIENLNRYPQLRGIASQIMSFLEYMESNTVKDGKYELLGEKLFAIVQRYNTRKKTGSRMESHKKYADLQYIYHGEEVIFYDSVDELEIEEDHRPEADILFYKKKADKGGILLAEGMFGYYEPQDAHMPGISGIKECIVTKVVFKILL